MITLRSANKSSMKYCRNYPYFSFLATAIRTVSFLIVDKKA